MCNAIFEYAKIILQDANGLLERKGVQIEEKNNEKYIIYLLKQNRYASNWMQIKNCVISIWEMENCIRIKKKVKL